MVQEDNNTNQQIKQSKDNSSKRKRIKSDLNNSKYVYHVYSKIRKIYPDITQAMVIKIIDRYFELTQNDLALGNTVGLGGLLGDLYVVKTKRKVFINEAGDLVNNLPIDQGKTMKLWKEQPELKGKTFIRHVNAHSNGFLFKLKYDKFKFPLKNKSIYFFKFSKPLRERLSENIINKEAQAYEIQT
jgi:predicted Zn-dependent protease with MMP-like domain